MVDAGLNRLGSVLSLQLKPRHGELLAVEELEAIAGQGIVGDYSFSKSARQVSMVSQSELRQFGYAPGQLRENVTVDFEGLQSLAIGSVLKIGEVELEIESDCAPCASMARMLFEDPQEFVMKMKGKRGMLAKVRRSGTIRVGDVVDLDAG